MTTLHSPRRRGESATPSYTAAALVDHHGQLLWQASLHADQSLTALAAGAPTAGAVAPFLDYLREEILPSPEAKTACYASTVTSTADCYKTIGGCGRANTR